MSYPPLWAISVIPPFTSRLVDRPDATAAVTPLTAMVWRGTARTVDREHLSWFRHAWRRSQGAPIDDDTFQTRDQVLSVRCAEAYSSPHCGQPRG